MKIVEQELGDAEPHVKAEVLINGDVGGKAMPKKVDKWWGYELHYKNDEEYCMKLLCLKQGGHTSMHFHVGKHETLLVTKGTLTLMTISDKVEKTYLVPEGVAWVVCPGYTHRLKAVHGEVHIVEASTYDREDDSVRIK